MSDENAVVQIPLLIFEAFTRDMHDAALTGAAVLEKMMAADNPKAVAPVFATAFEQLAVTFTRFMSSVKTLPAPPPLTVGWTVADVQTLFDCTEDQALTLLHDHHVKDRMVELGWGVFETIGQVHGLELTDMFAEDDEEDPHE